MFSIYKYDVNTGEYLETITFTTVGGSSTDYSFPKGHTDVPIPNFDNSIEKIFFKNGSWEIHNIKFLEGPPADYYDWDEIFLDWIYNIDKHKTQKIAEIANDRWLAETSGIQLNGISIPTDRESQSLITGAAFSATTKMMKSVLPEQIWDLLDQIPESVNWKASEWINLPNEQIIYIGLLVRLHVQAAFDMERQIKELIDQATTKEELDSIFWGMEIPVQEPEA